MKYVSRWCTLLLFFSIIPFTHAGQYFQDFSGYAVGTTSFTDGSQLLSTKLGSVAGVQDGNYKELQLTENNGGGLISAFELPDLDPSQTIYAFSAKWNSQVYRTTTNDADGFSFNFGQLGSVNLTSGAVESGYSTGLSFSVQTYREGNPGFYLRLNGNVLASVPYDTNTRWGLNNSTRHFFEVDWNYVDGLTVRMDGQAIFTKVATPGFVPQSGNRFVWAARCGAFTEQVRLDNITVVTGGNLVQVPMTNPYYYDANIAQSPVYAFDGNLNTVWADFNPVTPPLGYIGATVSPATAIMAYALVSPPPINPLSGPPSAPRGWTLQGSSDGNTWNACGSDGALFLNSLETRCFLSTNSSSFSAYRLNVTANNGLPGLGLDELQLYQFVPYSMPWLQTSAGDRNWQSIACSADGNKVYAVEFYGGYVWRSTNAGITWQPTGSPYAGWASVACSTNGSTVVAGSATSGLFVSTDSGDTWTAASGVPTDRIYWGVAASADGTVLYAQPEYNFIQKSTDSGKTWSPVNSFGASWLSIATSADGSKAIASASIFGDSTGFWVSTNAGAWNGLFGGSWGGTAMSADGTKMIAENWLGGIWTSTNSGATWTKVNLGDDAWWTLAASADGNTLLAGAGSQGHGQGPLVTSTDFGKHWSLAPVPRLVWQGSAMSSNGKVQYAAAIHVNYFDGPSPGAIYKYATPDANTQQKPVAMTSPASQVTLSAATLNGGAIGNFLMTSTWFEWGATTNYGNVTGRQDIGYSLANFSAAISNLTQSTTYHYRAVASNALGVAYSPDAVFTTVSTNEMFAITYPGNTIIPTSGNSPGAEQAPNAIDNNASSKYLNLDITNTGFTVFPTLTNVPVRALGLISAEDPQERDPASFMVYGSHDGTNFSVIASNAVPQFTSRRSIQSLAINNTNAYLAYRVIFPTVQNPATANSMQIAEVELLPYGDITSTNDIITLSLPNGASLATPPDAGPATALLDRQLGNATNKVAIFNVSNNVVAVITPAAGASIPKGFELIGGNDDASYPSRAPSSFTLEGSTDGTHFVILDSVTPVTPTANMQIQGFSFLNNTNIYRIYRATFGVPKSGDLLQVGEVRLFGLTLPPSLNIQSSGDNLLISWPLASGYSLQQNSTLDSTNWTFVTGSITVTNGLNQLTVPHGPGNNFYRLISQ